MGPEIHYGWYNFFFALAVLGVFTLHEMGHYLAAIFCGVNVESVIIGFGREIWGRTGGNGTRWSVRLLPVCGRVHLYADRGEGGARDRVRGAFDRQNCRRRFIIVAAGPFVNFVVALMALGLFYDLAGVPAAPPLAMGIEVGGPAEQAGLLPGDEIIGLDGQPVGRFAQLDRALKQPDTGGVLHLALLRHGSRIEVDMMPRRLTERDAQGFAHVRRQIGVLSQARPLRLTAVDTVNGVPTGGSATRARELLAPVLGRPAIIGMHGADRRSYDYRIVLPRTALDEAGSSRIVSLGPYHDNFYFKTGSVAAWREALRETGRLIHGLTLAMGRIGPVNHALIEPETTVTYATAPVRAVLYGFAHVTAALSVCIALINLLPLPGLDGGYLLAISVEALVGPARARLFRRPAQRLAVLAVVALWLLMNADALRGMMG